MARGGRFRALAARAPMRESRGGSPTAPGAESGGPQEPIKPPEEAVEREPRRGPTKGYRRMMGRISRRLKR